jgi:antitoxin (DNA-binding transcriptional repressor) of toxin-antitoxin stability system
VADFGYPKTIETLTVDRIVDDVRAGLAVIVAERNTVVAVVLPELDHIQTCNPVVWLQYIDSARRGEGLGARFVAAIRDRFERALPMTLACNGPRREAFFTACGFLVQERLEDENLVMIASGPRAT